MENYIKMINEATDYIRSAITDIPEIAIILGSGLGALSEEIENGITLKYEDIPHFKASTVAGHAGKLIAGTLKGRKVLIMSGRFHYYEGHSMDIVTLPVRVFAKLGIKNLIVTNAAGGIGDNLSPGSIMLINDHLSFMCPSPLIGANLDEFGPRFPDMTQVYTDKYLNLAKETAANLNIDICSGVYCYFRGPQYETPAEIRAVKLLGADAAGMSTVPEAIVARHCQMNVLGISLITNKAAGLGHDELSHEEVGKTAALAGQKMVKLVSEIVAGWN